jgi:hypothetical protein
MGLGHGRDQARLRQQLHRSPWQTASELQALGGHNSISELQKYIQEIEQDEQAVSGMAKVAAAQAKARTGSD